MTRITCNNCIIATTGDMPLIEQRGSDGIHDYQNRFAWRGERDYFDGFDVFWRIMNSTGQTGSQRFDFGDWKQFWQGHSELQTAGPNAVVWNQLPDEDRPFHSHTPYDYALDRTAFQNAAAGGASDNLDAGCLFNDLPQPPNDEKLADPADRRP